MTFLGGGERLCCESMRALLSSGHEITLVSQDFEPKTIEQFFGYDKLFDKINLMVYPRTSHREILGDTKHLIHHLRGQKKEFARLTKTNRDSFDIMFSTQDPGYFPDTLLPIVQWGYFPRYFPKFFQNSPSYTLRRLPLRLHYERKISRISLVLAISQYSKSHLDPMWKRPSVLIYPGCNMVLPGQKRNMVLTAARAITEKRLEIFWQVARLRPQYEFVMLLTQDQGLIEYSMSLSKQAPPNGTVIFNPTKEVYHEALGEARVYLHLMRNEHFGITIVEAMSACCTPIVHDSGGPREIVNQQTGYLWRDITDIPGLIDKAMRDRPLSLLRLRAESFSTEKFAKRISSLFSALRL